MDEISEITKRLNIEITVISLICRQHEAFLKRIQIEFYLNNVPSLHNFAQCDIIRYNMEIIS